VQQLERDGLLRRADDPLDRRAAVLHLTTEGRSVLQRARAAKRAALVRIFDRWDAEDRHAFAALLTRFAQELEAPPEPARHGRQRHGDAHRRRTDGRADRDAGTPAGTPAGTKPGTDDGTTRRDSSKGDGG
jgi:hypothetical protein